MGERLTKSQLNGMVCHCGLEEGRCDLQTALAEVRRLRGIIVAAEDEGRSHDFDGTRTEGWAKLTAEAWLIGEEGR